jgi:uncharacterized membrane protein
VILTVVVFQSADGAEAALGPLRDLSAAHVVRIDDAAVVTWPEGQRKPSARPLGDLSGGGLLWGGTWGVLLALIFVVPIAGPAFGAAAGAFAGALAEFGLDDAWVKRVRDAATPGTSALFLLGDGPLGEQLAAATGNGNAEAIETWLSPEHERRLRAALAEEPSAR